MALHASADKEKSLRSECERIVKKNNNDVKSMITDRNELDHQLRESKLQSRLDKEEFERLLHIAISTQGSSAERRGKRKLFS